MFSDIAGITIAAVIVAALAAIVIWLHVRYRREKKLAMLPLFPAITGHAFRIIVPLMQDHS